jgi:penicillin-binding protein 2
MSVFSGLGKGGGRRLPPESARASAARARGAHQVLTATFIVLVLRLFYLQAVDHERLHELARDNVLREEVLPAIRGVIRDRGGNVLVDSEPSCTVALDPFDRAFREPGRLGETLHRLAALIAVEPRVMAETIAKEKGRSYLPVYLKRNADAATVAYIEEHREQFAGVSIAIEPRRRYVNGPLAAHLLGYVGEITEAELERQLAAGTETRPRRGPAPAAPFADRRYERGDLIGRAGVEATFEDNLCGLNGVRLVEVNALGRRVDDLMPITRFAKLRPPVAGEEAILTLDLDLQIAAESAFPDSFPGAVVVLDARTGGVLAALSRPCFDPNEFAAGLSHEAWKRLDDDPAHPLHNRVTNSEYPPGSVFKVVTGSAALAENAVGPAEHLRSCVGGYQFGNRFFGCHHVHGPVVFADAMMVSCDAYFYQVGVRLGIDRLADYARRFGFTKPTGIEIGERKGLFPDAAWYNRNYGPGKWSKGAVLNLSIGQGEVLATPLQLATMMAAIGTGQVPVPHVMQSLGAHRIDPPAARPLDLPAEVRRQVVEALERVVGAERGTGKRARVPGVRVAGKTGTAQNPHGEDHAVFAAFAPVGAPEIAVAVVIENVGHGGEFAAPVAGAILRAYFGRGGGELAQAGIPAGPTAD